MDSVVLFFVYTWLLCYQNSSCDSLAINSNPGQSTVHCLFV